MTEAQDTTDRATKRLRRAARILALIWALALTLYGASCSADAAESPLIAGTPARTFLLCFGLPCLVAWATLPIAWRWEAAGGLLLLSQAVLTFLLCRAFYAPPAPPPGSPIAWPYEYDPTAWTTPAHYARTVLLPAALPLAPGLLFLASWWKSRPSEGPEDGE